VAYNALFCLQCSRRAFERVEGTYFTKKANAGNNFQNFKIPNILKNNCYFCVMKFVVNIKTKAEERMLTAFLDSMKIAYHAASVIENNIDTYNEFLKEYNIELDSAVNEIENNSYVAHKDVKKKLAERRKANE